MNTRTDSTPPPAPSAKRRIFVVDDHPIFRLGLATLIGEEADFDVCGQAQSTRQALEALRRTAADAVVVDVSLPGANGLELLKYLRVEHPEMPVLMLSVHDERTYALRCMRAGASGYLMKSDTDDRLILALRKILSGGIYVSDGFGEELIYRVSQGENSDSTLDLLSDRELEVLQHVGSGKSSRDIADNLHLSVKTVESHRLHIKEKLQLDDAAKLVRFAMDWVAEQSL